MESIFCSASSIHFPKSLFSAASPCVQKSSTTTPRSQLGFPRSSTPIVLAKNNKDYHSPMPCVQGLMGLRGTHVNNTLGILGGKIKDDMKRFAFDEPVPGDSSGFLLTGKEALKRLQEASKQRDKYSGLEEALERLQKASKKQEVGNIDSWLKTDKEALKKLREAGKEQEGGDIYSLLKSVSLELVMLGMGDTAVLLLETAMNEERPAVQRELLEVLVVEALICQGKYEKASEYGCLKDPILSSECHLYRAVVYLLNAEKEWNEFNNSLSYDLPDCGREEDTSMVKEFADFKTIVDNLKKATESNNGRGKKNT